jgi:hypothetical protein
MTPNACVLLNTLSSPADCVVPAEEQVTSDVMPASATRGSSMSGTSSLLASSSTSDSSAETLSVLDDFLAITKEINENFSNKYYKVSSMQSPTTVSAEGMFVNTGLFRESK